MLIEKISELNYRARDISLHSLISLFRHPANHVLSAFAVVDLLHPLRDCLQEIRLDALSLLYHALQLVPAGLVHFQGDFNCDKAHVWIRVEEGGPDQFLEDYAPVPGLVVDSKLLNYVEEDLEPGQDNPPLDFVRSGAFLGDVHDAFDELPDVYSGVPEQGDQTVE